MVCLPPPLLRAADSGTAAVPPGAESGTIQEVVVTARRFAEDLQNVPIAVTALSASTMQTQEVTNLQDLNSFVPNMKIAADRATSSTINVYIRGVGQSDPLWGFEPGVGVYIDDVYLARPQAALLDVIDVQDLEILRGPQGTLYGKNTIAGAIKYVTREIDGPATLTVSATGGNYGEHDEKLSFSTPVIEDHVYFGLALADLQHKGYGEVVAQAGIRRRAPIIPSARRSRTRTCCRGAPISRSSGARARSSRSSPRIHSITPMLRAASGSIITWHRSSATHSTRARICRSATTILTAAASRPPLRKV